MRAACAKQSVSECKYRNRRNGEEKRCAIKSKRGESIFHVWICNMKWEKTTNIAFLASFPRVFCWDCLWKYWGFFVTCLSEIALRMEIWKVFHFGHVVPNSRCVFEYLANISQLFFSGSSVKSQKNETGERFMRKAGVCRIWQMDPAVLLPSSFLNFLYSVFIVAACLFGSVRVMEDVGQRS